MTVHVTPLGAAIFVIGVVVAHFVYRHSATALGPASRGDVVGAIGCATAVITALVLLLGGGVENGRNEAPLPASSGSPSPPPPAGEGATRE